MRCRRHGHRLEVVERIPEVTVSGAWQDDIPAITSNIEARPDKASGVPKLTIPSIEIGVEATGAGVRHRRFGAAPAGILFAILGPRGFDLRVVVKPPHSAPL